MLIIIAGIWNSYVVKIELIFWTLGSIVQAEVIYVGKFAHETN